MSTDDHTSMDTENDMPRPYEGEERRRHPRAEVFDFASYLRTRQIEQGVYTPPLEASSDPFAFKHFDISEFDCRCRSCLPLPPSDPPDPFTDSRPHNNRMDLTFVRTLDAMRAELGFPFRITSGYRCPDHNADISSTGRTGPHTTGFAADIRLYGERAFMVVALAPEYGFSGIGISQKGDLWQRFIHLDMLRANPDGTTLRPRIWSY